MRKIYIGSLCTVLLAFSFAFSFAQVTYTTVQNGNMSLIATWDGNGVPPSPCVNCTIKINNDVNLNYPLAVNTTSLILIANGTTVNINNFLQLDLSVLVVYNNATLNVNDEIHLYNASNVRLTNTNSFIDASNNGGNPSHGTIDPGDVAGSGIFYILQSAPPVIATTEFDAVLSQYGYGGHFIPVNNLVDFKDYNDPYSFNCHGTCLSNLIYGPAVSNLSTTGVVIFGQTTVLPITLSKFGASLNIDRTVDVLWSTSLEINSDYFSVERSPDGIGWIPLGTVKAKGTSSVNVNYSYKDNSPINPIGYYRLKMVDIDGKFKYSKVVSVNLDEKAVPLVVYNNPFKDQIRLKINVSSATRLDMTVTDMLGRTFTHQSLNAQAGDNFVNITPAGITEGLYILNINGQNYHQTVKLAKQ